MSFWNQIQAAGQRVIDGAKDYLNTVTTFTGNLASGTIAPILNTQGGSMAAQGLVAYATGGASLGGGGLSSLVTGDLAGSSASTGGAGGLSSILSGGLNVGAKSGDKGIMDILTGIFGGSNTDNAGNKPFNPNNPKDETTWLSRNWGYLVAGVILVPLLVWGCVVLYKRNRKGGKK